VCPRQISTREHCCRNCTCARRRCKIRRPHRRKCAHLARILHPSSSSWLRSGHSTTHTMLEIDVHAWTSQMSMRRHRQKWTFVKQIWKVLAHGPRRRPRVDIAEVHAWTLCKATSVAHPKKNLSYSWKNTDSRGIWTPVYCMKVQCLTN
jgi:hypothetical protein